MAAPPDHAAGSWTMAQRERESDPQENCLILREHGYLCEQHIMQHLFHFVPSILLSSSCLSSHSLVPEDLPLQAAPDVCLERETASG